MGKKKEAEQKQPLTPAHPEAAWGLSEAEVREREEKGYINTPVSSPTKTVGQIVRSNIFTYFNLIFILLAAALAAVGAFTDMTFMGIVIINTVIGIVQEINAKKTLDQLSLLSEPKAHVVRQGQVTECLTEQLVQDDVAVFSSGSQICADGVVLEGEVQVNESLITGESDEITKHPGDELLSGSFVVSGTCRAQLQKVGADSFVSKLTLEAKKTKKKQKGMMRSLDNLVKIIGILIIPLGVAIFLRQQTLGLALKENVQATTAALVGMIPEGLYLLADIALAVSVVKLARKKTLVHDLKCIETLARVDVLCVDKTGTITESRMKVNDVISLQEDAVSAEELKRLLRDFAGNMKAENATMQALQEGFPTKSPRPAIKTVPFSSVTKCSRVAFSESEEYVLGAGEFILGERYNSIAAAVREYAEQGNRVLLLARVNGGEPQPLGLVLLMNPIRPEAEKTFRYFAEQGVTIKVISGDNPATAAAAAKKAGISGSDQWVDLSSVQDEDFDKLVQEYTVFGRVTPEQKKKLVQALKKAGHTVAMTGDGVNDVLALKEADCSVAMASGSEVACQVSHLVLLNSNFAAMPSVVAEGRQVINNIQRSASLFLVKNIFSFILALISIFALFAYPLSPIQISLVSTLTIGIPGFFLALEKNHERVKGNFMKNVLFQAFPAGLTDVVIVMGAILFGMAFAMPQEMVSTIVVILMEMVGFAMLYRVSRPFNWRRAVLLGGLVALFVLAVLLLPDLFALTALDFGGWLVFATLLLLIPSVMMCCCRALDQGAALTDKLRTAIRKKREAREAEEF